MKNILSGDKIIYFDVHFVVSRDLGFKSLIGAFGYFEPINPFGEKI